MLKNNFLCFLFVSLCFFAAANNSYGQNKSYSLGIDAGLSSFQSLSISVTGIHTGLFFEFPVWFSKAFNFQTSLFYIRKTEYFLPEDNSSKYYPYLYGATFSGIMRQRINVHFFTEEQAGLLLLKNNFFADLNETNYGVSFGIAGGLDLREDLTTGFLLSVGYKGGITFNASTPSFNSFFIQAQYCF
jgi:hypothetical protein